MEVDDGWHSDEPEQVPGPRTEVFTDTTRTVISKNQSPDVPFNQSINPYKGCEHGCIYCFARPTHAYLDLSPGLDFESKIFAKPNAAELLRKELSKPNYVPDVIALGANTDPYQPLERRLGITRDILTVLSEFNHPVAIVTKGALVERDIDILSNMAQHDLAQVFISVTTLNAELGRKMEPRATAPQRRVQTIAKLTEADVPVGVLFAPVIPALNDAEMETVLSMCADAGATSAAYILLRLPLELTELFTDWLEEHYPLKAQHVLNVIRDMRGGKTYDSRFGERMRGRGQFAELMAQRFKLACKKTGLNQRDLKLDSSRFCAPSAGGRQLGLFG